MMGRANPRHAARGLLLGLAGLTVLAFGFAGSRQCRAAAGRQCRPKAFSFVPVDVGSQTGIFKRNGLDLQVASFGGDAKLQQAMAADSIDVGLGLGAGPGLHRQGLAGQGASPLWPGRR